MSENGNDCDFYNNLILKEIMSNGPTLIYHITHKDNLEGMMISLVSGNLLEAQTEALVNTVNCIGIMGKPSFNN